MSRMEVRRTRLNDLPELAFEKILSYLSLEDLIKARAVSRRWYETISSFKVKSLCCSRRPIGFIEGNGRLVSGAFAQNFIGSPRYRSFFDTFGNSLLSSLKRLRLCDFGVSKKNRRAVARILRSFDQLEQLDIIRFKWNLKSELNLPMLKSIQLESVSAIEAVTLNALRLEKVRLVDCRFLELTIVHAGPLKKLITDRLEDIDVDNLKNLKYLAIGPCEEIDSALLPSLKQLKELHLTDSWFIEKLFEQKQRYGRVDLKIFYCGCLLDGQDDPAFLLEGHEATIDFLVKNPSRLADEIPFCRCLSYTTIELLASGPEMSLLKRFTDWNAVEVDKPVQDIQRFLDVLDNFRNIAKLVFDGEQPQDLFDRLPDHGAVQSLAIKNAKPNLESLFRFESLVRLDVCILIDADSVHRFFKRFAFLSTLKFKFDLAYAKQTDVEIKANHSKSFEVSWFFDDRPLKQHVRYLPDAFAFFESFLGMF